MADFSELHREISRKLREAAALTHPYPFRPLTEGRPAAVLILTGIREGTGEIEILITRRPENLETHKGQYALPGGMQDPGDDSLEATALRETHEEMGIGAESVAVFGQLPELWTPSGFRVTPVVGLLHLPIEAIEVRPNPHEIDFWFWCPLTRLRDVGVYTNEARMITHAGTTHSVQVDVYQVDEHRIWGATGAMLRNFIVRLEKVEAGKA